MTWRYFKFEDFACKCGCGSNLIDGTFIDKLDELRERCGFPIPITSGYRCPEWNQKVSTTGPAGPHTTGHAADLGVRGERAYTVIREALAMRFSGIGINQKGVARFVHLDDLPNTPSSPRPNTWSY